MASEATIQMVFHTHFACTRGPVRFGLFTVSFGGLRYKLFMVGAFGRVLLHREFGETRS